MACKANSPLTVNDPDPIWAMSLGDDPKAAAFLGTTPANLRQARHTGKLWGVDAPEYVKVGRTVRYRMGTLAEWIAKLPTQSNTAMGA